MGGGGGGGEEREGKKGKRTLVVVKVHFADIFAGARARFHDGRVVVVGLRPGVRVVMWLKRLTIAVAVEVEVVQCDAIRPRRCRNVRRKLS